MFRADEEMQETLEKATHKNHTQETAQAQTLIAYFCISMTLIPSFGATESFTVRPEIIRRPPELCTYIAALSSGGSKGGPTVAQLLFFEGLRCCTAVLL